MGLWVHGRVGISVVVEVSRYHGSDVEIRGDEKEKMFGLALFASDCELMID